MFTGRVENLFHYYGNMVQICDVRHSQYAKTARELYRLQSSFIRTLHKLLRETTPGELESRVSDDEVLRLIEAAKGDWGKPETFEEMERAYIPIFQRCYRNFLLELELLRARR